MKLAVVDWGIGGLCFLDRFTARHPSLPTVYLSDAGFTPYGKVPRRALAQRIDHVLRRLADEHDATHAVLACNAASTVLADLRATRDGLPVIGVIAPAVAALRGMRPAEIGVIGGRRTVRSGLYGRALRSAGHRVRQRIAQPLSAHVEAGRLASDDVRADVARILAPLRGVEVLVMACTHYCALAPLFAEHCPRATLFDPVDATLAQVERDWPIPGRSAGAPAVRRILTTGDADAMRRAAGLAFGMRLDRVESIDPSRL